MPRPDRRSFGKPKDTKKAFKDLFLYLKPYVVAIVFAVIFSIIVTIITLAGPSFIEEITNLITKNITNIPLQKVAKLCIIILTLYALSAILNYAVGFIMSTVSNLFSKKLRKDISRKINVLPLSYLDHTTHGDMLSRITNDVDLISSNLSNSIITLLTSALLLIGSVVMMFIKSWLLAICVISLSLLGFVFIAIIMKKSQKYFVRQQSSLGQLNGHVEEIYTGHTIVKAYNAEEEAKEKFTSINNELYNSAWKSQFLSGLMMPIMALIGNIGYVIIAVLGAILCIENKIDIGVIASFTMYIGYFSRPLNQIAQITTQLQSTLAASERVFEVLNQNELENENYKTQKIENCKGKVVFDHVRFGYNKNTPIIKDFSAVVKPGQKVAIVGPTGAGKTTIVNLLMRFYEVDGGQILIDDIPTTNITRENLHDLFSMVLQDTWIFNGTVKDNVVYSKENVSADEVVEACKSVGLHHFIKTLPNGYDTMLSENTSISAGQKQLLTIARAMIQNSPMLILDEATSSVDTRLELAIQKAINKLTKNRTAFIIAHRLSTIKNADLILVMQNGDVVESGTHKELLEKGGFYAELYNSQFED